MGRGDKPEIILIFTNFQHPYTKALLSATLVPNPRIELGRKRIILTGDVASAIDLPDGCRFNIRCPYAHAKCHEIEPELFDVESDHMVSCHLFG